MNKEIWRQQDETKLHQVNLQSVIDKTKEDLSSGVLLVHNQEKLAMEYAYNIGYIAGLEKALSNIDEDTDYDSESETIPR